MDAWKNAAADVVTKLRQRTITPKRLEEINWRLNLQMAQSNKSKMKLPNAMFELKINDEDSEVGSVYLLPLNLGLCTFLPVHFKLKIKNKFLDTVEIFRYFWYYISTNNICIHLCLLVHVFVLLLILVLKELSLFVLYRNFFQIKPKRETKCYLSTIYCYDFFSLWSTQAKEKIRFEMTHDELYSFYNQVGGFEIHIYIKYMCIYFCM